MNKGVFFILIWSIYCIVNDKYYWEDCIEIGIFNLFKCKNGE